MKGRRRLLSLILVMTAVSLAVGLVTIYLLYDAALEGQRARLLETLRSQARLVKTIAGFTIESGPQDWEAAAVRRILDAHKRSEGFGDTGEFTLAEREGDRIVFLLTREYSGREDPRSVPFHGALAEPMRRALSGMSGTIIGSDYRGERVLAAYEAMPELGWGVVAKIDLKEIRAPFVKSGIIAGCVAILVVVLGSTLFLRITGPLVSRLQISEAKTRGIVETATDSIVTIDCKGVIESVNPACERLFGYTAEEMVGRNARILMPSPYREEHDEYLARYLTTGEKRIIGIGRQMEGRRKDGTTFPMEISVNEVRIGGERWFTGIIRDITERIEAERALKTERDRAQKYLDTAAVIVVALDVHGRVTLINKKGCQLLGYEESEVLGEDWFAKFLPESVRGQTREVFDGLRQCRKEEFQYFENPVLTKDQREIIVDWHNSCLRNEEGEFAGTLSSGVDITERKRAEEKLIEQASLARLGEMATVVAHEVKNPLAGIAGAARVLIGRLSAASPEGRILQEMIDRVMSLNNTVNDILVFSRPRRPEQQTVPIQLLLEDSVSLLSEDPQFREIEVDLSGEDMPVSCDVEMMKAVFLNLLVNAAQAMSGKGKLSVAVDNTDHYCRVSFRDTGPGIPKELRKKIFEPFFTTKSRGTGLGLPIARRVIELHGGGISVDCPADGGTTVLVQLPVEQSNSVRA